MVRTRSGLNSSSPQTASLFQRLVDWSDRPRKIIGTKKEVWAGKALRTSGGLKKTDLTKSKWGAIVSKKKQKVGKQLYRNYPPHITQPHFQ